MPNLSSVLVSVAVALFNLLTNDATLGAPDTAVDEDDDADDVGTLASEPFRPIEFREALEEERAVVGVPVRLRSFSSWRYRSARAGSSSAGSPQCRSMSMRTSVGEEVVMAGGWVLLLLLLDALAVGIT